MRARRPPKSKPPAPDAPDPRVIRVAGAREHNLKNINLELPRDRLVVITGLSGSGKSSLAFDTIYAEGQRRYVESLSAYARQFLETMRKPDVDHIDGLSPAISIEQKTTSRNPRSTVGTVTEIYDYMRLLLARAGTAYSPATGLPIESQSVSQMIDRLGTLPPGTRLHLLAPIVRGRKGVYRKELEDLMRQGFQRVKIDGAFHEMDGLPAMDGKRKHDISVVVDRLVIGAGTPGSRLADSLETALNLADGIAVAEPAGDGDGGAAAPERMVFSTRFACPVSGFTIDEIEPRLFSFNSPFGACPACDGLGTRFSVNPELVIPAAELSLEDGAVAPWSRSVMSSYYRQTLRNIARHYGAAMDRPWKRLPARVRKVILHGSGKDVISFSYTDGKRTFRTRKAFEGIIPHLERRYRETESNWSREEIQKYQTITDCQACAGFRLRPEALAVRIGGLHIGQISGLSIREAERWFGGLAQTLTPKQNEIARPILKEISERLRFLNNVGLEYLALGRSSGTLSGGEQQRIRLASQIGSGLTGVLYVLDEPSIGLHQRDNARLMKTLKRLRDMGNTVIVVEHDEDAILSADHVVDMGPGAGVCGGEVVAQGPPPAIMANGNSLTGCYLSGARSIPVPRTRRRPRADGPALRVAGATGHNLQNITVDLPLGVFTCVTGVSGSGKSTLLIDTIYKTAARKLNGARTQPAPCASMTGLEHLDKVIDIDQSPIGRTPRSNPATYTGVFSPIRDWFAGLPSARARGYKPGRFSFNVKGGRCQTCQGDGVIKIEMHFLPDVYVECETCKGRRYNRETLEVAFRGKSIADVLDMTVDEAAEFFNAVPAIYSRLHTLQRVGLGYIKTGQQATTLSGGEAQRVKLAKELSRRATGRTLYVLDEPTTGLHFHDVAKLLEVLHELVSAGNTVAVIEHNLDVIKTADWIVDLGPEGGDGGGRIVATGTPEKTARTAACHTGTFLKRYFPSRPRRKAGSRRPASPPSPRKPSRRV